MTDTRLDHAAPWVLDTRALGLAKRQGPGQSHPFDLRVPAPPGTESGVLSIREGAEVHVTGLLESVAEGVLASGTATAVADGSCSRCLQEITVPVRADFRELYAYPDSATAETTDPDEVPRLVDDLIDLAPLVHDELVLAMPAVPVCSPDCPGLCPECGERLDSVGPDHRHDTLDPRWAALAGMVQPDPETDTDADTAASSDPESPNDRPGTAEPAAGTNKEK
jgi:uncharacterized protein